MPSITNLATTTTALTAVEKADYVEKVKTLRAYISSHLIISNLYIVDWMQR